MLPNHYFNNKKLWQKMNFLLDNRFIYFKLEKLELYFSLSAIVMIGIGLYAGLFIAPIDYEQQDAFRIIYCHVPAAAISISIYAVCGISSFIYLVWKINLFNLVVKHSAPIGATFTLVALITGSIWGKPMWGTWWVWDARLTSELLLLFLYMGQIAVRNTFKGRDKAAKLAAIIAVLGLIDLPIIHYSVYWWHTLHQKATILQFAKPNIDSSMLYPLLSVLSGTYLFYFYMLLKNIRTDLIYLERETRK